MSKLAGKIALITGKAVGYTVETVLRGDEADIKLRESLPAPRLSLGCLGWWRLRAATSAGASNIACMGPTTAPLSKKSARTS